MATAATPTPIATASVDTVGIMGKELMRSLVEKTEEGRAERKSNQGGGKGTLNEVRLCCFRSRQGRDDRSSGPRARLINSPPESRIIFPPNPRLLRCEYPQSRNIQVPLKGVLVSTSTNRTTQTSCIPNCFYRHHECPGVPITSCSLQCVQDFFDQTRNLSFVRS